MDKSTLVRFKIGQYTIQKTRLLISARKYISCRETGCRCCFFVSSAAWNRGVLPQHAQEIYKEAFNHAFDEYAERGPEGREETAHKVAWSAVKKKYRKDEASGRWRAAQ